MCMNNRLEWLDGVKGIAIILVVVGHNIGSNTLIFQYIYGFHMPLFFFLSGYVYNENKYPNLLCLVNQKLRTILNPYFIFGAISVLMYSIYINNDMAVLRTFMIANRAEMSLVPFNTPLWFLPCLFIIVILYYFVKKYIHNVYILLLLLFLLSYFGFHTIQAPILPWTMDSALYYMLYYGIGHTIRSRKLLESNHLKGQVSRIIFIISCLIHCAQLLISNEMSGLPLFFDYGYSIILALSGIVVYCFIGMKLQHFKTIKQIFAFLGQNSLVILALHIPLREYVVGALIWGLSGSFYDWVVMRVLFKMSALFLCIPCILYINKFFPHFIGKSKSKERDERHEKVSFFT